MWKVLEEQGVLGEQVGWWAASGQSTAAEWRGLGSREPQNEMGPKQTDRHAWLLPGVAMWSWACLSVDLSGCGEGKIRGAK